MLTAVVLALATAFGAPSAVATETTIICDPHRETCTVTVVTPPSPGGSTGGGDTGEARVCIGLRGEVTPCFSETFGWFNDSDGC